MLNRQSLLAVLIVVSPGLTVAEIYRWVDEQGRVHYGDRAASQGSPNATVEDTGPTPRTTTDADRKQTRDRLLESFRKDREQAREKSARAKAEKKLNAKNCGIARKRLEQIAHASYLYRESEDGERAIYSEVERAAAIKVAKDDIKQWCN